MSRPTLGSVSEELYAGMAPLVTDDEEQDYAAAKLVGTGGENIQEIEDLVRDTPAGPGWSAIMDLDRAPVKFIDWLAQLAGVQTADIVRLNLGADLPSTSLFPSEELNPGELGQIVETEAAWTIRKRERILEGGGQKRGTPAAMRGALLPYLVGRRVVFFNERDTSAYHMTVMVYASECPDPVTAEKALRAQKPAAIVLVFLVITGQTYRQLRDNHTDYADVDSSYDTYEEARRDEPGP